MLRVELCSDDARPPSRRRGEPSSFPQRGHKWLLRAPCDPQVIRFGLRKTTAGGRSEVVRISNERALVELKKILREEGVRPALVFLNHLTEHRFSALYQFEDERLRNLYFYDRETPELEWTDKIRVTASYCVFLRDQGRLFHTSDALRDERVRSHPQREKVQAYCGVPVLDAEGKLFGSICHFDYKPRVITDEDVDLMEAVALLLCNERAIGAGSAAFTAQPAMSRA